MVYNARKTESVCGSSHTSCVAFVARILLSLVFVVFGLNAFLHFIPRPQLQGLAGQFFGVMFGSHYYVVVFGTQLLGGLLLLSNRYVPLGLLLLGPVILNILCFHLFLDAANVAPALVVTVLWLIVFLHVRSAFVPLFKPTLTNSYIES